MVATMIPIYEFTNNPFQSSSLNGNGPESACIARHAPFQREVYNGDFVFHYFHIYSHLFWNYVMYIKNKYRINSIHLLTGCEWNSSFIQAEACPRGKVDVEG